MDFKSLMSAQISKSKPPATNGTPSKYQRRADAERDRERKYAEEQAQAEREKEERLAKKRKLEDEEAERNAIREEKKRKLAEESRIRREAEEAEEERLRRKRLGLPELRDSETPDVEEQVDIEDEELRVKLKGMGQVESLDDESHAARLVRYYRAKRRKDKERKWYPGPISTTIEPLPADELILPDKPPSPDDHEARVKLHRQISSYLNFVLGEWGSALAGRDKDVASSSEGTTASNNYKVALEDLKPLMRRLEAGYREASGPKSMAKKDGQNVQSSGGYEPLPQKALLQPLVEILHLTQGRNYRDAVDAYLRLSIGKAAWPIGVTMVGIHERSAREKLHEDGKGKDDIAQIMSDETTRKWLQSLKRLVSFAQTRWQVWDLGQLMG